MSETIFSSRLIGISSRASNSWMFSDTARGGLSLLAWWGRRTSEGLGETWTLWLAFSSSDFRLSILAFLREQFDLRRPRLNPFDFPFWLDRSPKSWDSFSTELALSVPISNGVHSIISRSLGFSPDSTCKCWTRGGLLDSLAWADGQALAGMAGWAVAMVEAASLCCFRFFLALMALKRTGIRK